MFDILIQSIQAFQCGFVYLDHMQTSVSQYLLRSGLICLQYYTVSDLLTKMRLSSWPHVHSVFQIEKQFALNDNAKRHLMISISRSKCSFSSAGSYSENCEHNPLAHALFRICINFHVYFAGDIDMAAFLTICLICDHIMNNFDIFMRIYLFSFEQSDK